MNYYFILFLIKVEVYFQILQVINIMDKHKKFKKFGINVQNIRKKQQMTLEELSNKTGISINYLRRIESGNAGGIRISQVLKIAFSMNIEPYMLFENM